MATGIIRRGWFGWAAPAGGIDLQAPAVASASGAATSVAIVFNEALRAGPAFGQFAVTADGVSKAVSAAAVAGSTLTLTCATIGGAGHAVVVTYTPAAPASGHLADNSPRNNEFPAGVLASYTS